MAAKKKEHAVEEQELTLEESFAKLDEIIQALESGESSLEDSFEQYQSGMKLIQSCGAKIDQVEKKILMMNGDGGLDEF